MGQGKLCAAKVSRFFPVVGFLLCFLLLCQKRWPEQIHDSSIFWVTWGWTRRAVLFQINTLWLLYSLAEPAVTVLTGWGKGNHVWIIDRQDDSSELLRGDLAVSMLGRSWLPLSENSALYLFEINGWSTISLRWSLSLTAGCDNFKPQLYSAGSRVRLQSNFIY